MRAFVAVWPPPAVVDKLGRLERPPLPGVRWTTPDQWHVTLRFLGEIDGEDIERGKAALAVLGPDGRDQGVTAVGGPALERLTPNVLCLPVAGLDELAGAVRRLTAGIGAPVGDRPFLGHLTIARSTRSASFGRAPGAIFSATWPVEEVTLVTSDLHPQGARYRVIHRVALVGPSDRGEGGAVADLIR